ncbi:hypothetical protein BN2475_1400001 [Paraburkholderia ribeironis]|uniref:Uncharacterized protein n=1 Tax=Paraburkholderia ribeironis TaxID=1247936 RepID=A0A1N7SQ41_9BURK|nr:hypothetical protein BN2475_1400001 [Paraburkholderia ribeironis]
MTTFNVITEDRLALGFALHRRNDLLIVSSSAFLSLSFGAPVDSFVIRRSYEFPPT